MWVLCTGLYILGSEQSMCREQADHAWPKTTPWGLAGKNGQKQSSEGKFWFLLTTVMNGKSQRVLNGKELANEGSGAKRANEWALWEGVAPRLWPISTLHLLLFQSSILRLLTSWGHWITSENTFLHPLKIWLRNKISKVFWDSFMWWLSTSPHFDLGHKF